MAIKKKLTDVIPQVGVKNVPTEIVAKIQVIAGLEGYPFNDIYNLAFVKFVELYETKNGKIKIQPKGKGLEGL